MLLLLSMNEHYAMEIDIIKVIDNAQSYSVIQARLKEKEAALNSDLLSDINESARKANFGTNQEPSIGKICFGCKISLADLPNHHRKQNCPKYLATEAGKAWARSEKRK